ncbi:MAG: hypothetical protein RSE01_05760 [Akkermansia sp.]
MNFPFFLTLTLSCMGSLAFATPQKCVWDFNDLKGWSYESQDKNPDKQCAIANGSLKIWTKAGSVDRKKVHTTDKIYTSGRYKWRTFISPMGKGDQASIGSWIYCDDQHEIDFEVGYGTQKARQQLKAKNNELIVYMTNQAHPYSSITATIKPGWHIFEIDLSVVNGKYKTQWFIDGKLKHTLQQTFGPEIAFLIYCSVENLSFLGDHRATKDNYGLFDRVEYTPHP